MTHKTQSPKTQSPKTQSPKTAQPKTPKTLSTKVRIIIGLLSLPSLILTAMLIKTAMNDMWDTVGAFEVVYAAVGLFAAFISLTGKRYF
ncbi:hypothetical protein ACFO4O_15765 [Glaciecola siphonariae]|uniref:Uncharacterized protein n=1 Tax=Glaciecola siphonariae TaxID=521012 RepID=A0ABV9LYI4_9ALTE